MLVVFLALSYILSCDLLSWDKQGSHSIFNHFLPLFLPISFIFFAILT